MTKHRAADLDGAEIRMSLIVAASLDPSDRATLDHVPAGRYRIVLTPRVVVASGDRRHPVLMRSTRDLPVDVE